jgi:hypothetical protein
MAGATGYNGSAPLKEAPPAALISGAMYLQMRLDEFLRTIVSKSNVISRTIPFQVLAQSAGTKVRIKTLRRASFSMIQLQPKAGWGAGQAQPETASLETRTDGADTV